MLFDIGAVFLTFTAYPLLDNHPTHTRVLGDPLLRFYLPREYLLSVLQHHGAICGNLDSLAHFVFAMETEDPVARQWLLSSS